MTVESVGSSVVVLHVAGEVDRDSAPQLVGQVHQYFSDNRPTAGVPSLILDLSGVTFLGSAGLAALADAQNLGLEHAVAVRVVAPTRMVLRPLEVTGLDKVLDVVTDLPSAVEPDTD